MPKPPHPTPERDYAPFFWLLLPPLFWASNIVAGRAVVDTVSPFTLTPLRWLLGAFLLSLLCGRQLWRERFLVREEWPKLILYSITAIIGVNILAYFAVLHTEAVNAAIVNGLLPIVIILASWIGLGERLTRRQTLGVTISFLGIVVVAARGSLDVLLGLQLNPGDLFMLAALTMWGTYSVAYRRFKTRFSPLPFATIIAFLGALLTLPLMVWDIGTGGRLPDTPQLMGIVVYIALFPSCAALLIWNRAVAAVGPNTAGYFTNLIPVYGSLLAVGLLEEAFHPYHIVGIFLIFVGIYFAVVSARTTPPDARRIG